MDFAGNENAVPFHVFKKGLSGVIRTKGLGPSVEKYLGKFYPANLVIF
jgi:hypothetical protein